MENPIKMDDLGGKPTIFGNTHIGKDFSIPMNSTIFELKKMVQELSRAGMIFCR